MDKSKVIENEIEKNEEPKKKEENDIKNKKKSSGVYRNTIIAIIGIVLISFIFINRNELKPDVLIESISNNLASMGTGDGYPYDINSNSVIQMDRMNNDIALLTDNSFIILNQTAKVVLNHQHAFATPGMDISKNRSIIYEQGGKRFQICNKKSVIYEKTMSENIITCSIGENGTFAVVTQSSTASCELKIYSRNFVELLTWYSSGNHIIDVTISSDGKKAAIVTSGADSGELKSTIYVIDFTQDEPVAKFDYMSTIFVSVDYSKNGCIIAVGDNLISIIGPGNEKNEDILSSDSTLKGIDTQNLHNTTVLYSVYNSTNLSSIVLINENAELANRIEIEKGIKFSTSSGTNIFAVSDNQILCYNEFGELFNSIDIPSDASNLVLIGNSVYVLCANGISQYSIDN